MQQDAEIKYYRSEMVRGKQTGRKWEASSVSAPFSQWDSFCGFSIIRHVSTKYGFQIIAENTYLGKMKQNCNVSTDIKRTENLLRSVYPSSEIVIGESLNIKLFKAIIMNKTFWQLQNSNVKVLHTHFWNRKPFLTSILLYTTHKTNRQYINYMSLKAIYQVSICNSFDQPCLSLFHSNIVPTVV
jgi:hypothetical protein